MRDSGLEEGHGEDRTQSRHTLNSLSLLLLFSPFFLLSLLRVSAGPTMFPPLYDVFCHALPPPPPHPDSFHIFITPFPLSISPCVSARVSTEDHTVSHIPAQLMTNWNMELLNLPPAPAKRGHLTPPLLHTNPDTHTHTHIPFQLFLPPLKTSQHFFIYSPFPFSLTLPLSLPVDISPKAHHTFP